MIFFNYDLLINYLIKRQSKFFLTQHWYFVPGNVFKTLSPRPAIAQVLPNFVSILPSTSTVTTQFSGGGDNNKSDREINGLFVCSIASRQQRGKYVFSLRPQRVCSSLIASLWSYLVFHRKQNYLHICQTVEHSSEVRSVIFLCGKKLFYI